MSEIDLIVKYLEKYSFHTTGISYYDETFSIIADGNVYLGAKENLPNYKAYFFGHVQIYAEINGVVVPANRNMLTLIFMSRIGSSAVNMFESRQNIGVNEGMSLLGDGTYHGCKRLYGMGFNVIQIASAGMGAAAYDMKCSLNGYIFIHGTGTISDC